MLAVELVEQLLRFALAPGVGEQGGEVADGLRAVKNR